MDAFPILTVADLAASRAFYEQLGFVHQYQFPPEGEPAFVTLQRDGATIGLAAADPDARDRFAYWLYVHDVDGTFEQLAAGGAPVVEGPADQPWGERVATVRDPDGNVVHLGQAAAPPVP